LRRGLAGLESVMSIQHGMKNTQYIFLSLIFFSCSENNANRSEIKSQQTKRKLVKTKIIDIKEFKKDHINPCDTFSIEVENIYPEIDSLPPAHLDTAYLDNNLKIRGFKTFKSGWGNFQDGPRMISLELSDGSCNCNVYKKYVLRKRIDENGQTKNYYKVVERIVCNAANNGVE